MKTMKKALSLILAVVMLLSCFVGMTFTTSAEETEYSECTRTSAGSMGYHSINTYYKVPHMSFRTNINYDFIAFNFDVVAYADPSLTHFTYKLYKWDTSFEKTMEANPVAEQMFTNVSAEDFCRIEFDKAMPAGEYLFQIFDSIGMNIDLDKNAATASEKGTFYLGTTERTDISLKLTVYTTDASYTEGTMFSKEPTVTPETTAPVTVAPETAAPETAAPETVAPETAAPETTTPETTTPEPEVPAVPEYSETSRSFTGDLGYHGLSYYGVANMSYRVAVNYDFTAFNFDVSTTGATNQSFTYKLYKWDTSLNQTLASDPVAEQTFTNVEKGTTYRLELETAAEAGEYLFYICEATSNVIIDLHKNEYSIGDELGTFYMGANERLDIIPKLTVYTTDETYESGTMFGHNSWAHLCRNYDRNSRYDLNTGKTYAYRTVINEKFNSFGIAMANFGVSGVTCKIGIYKWDGNFDNTIAGDPIIIKETNVQNGPFHWLEFEAIPAGEYLFYIYDTSSTVAIYGCKTATVACDRGYNYLNGVEDTEAITPYITVKTAAPFAGELFSKGGAQEIETYIYHNSLDGEQVYSGNAPLDAENLPADILEKLNLYANGTYNEFTGFELVSSIEGLHTYRSVHNTEAAVSVTDGEKKEMEGGYYILTAAESKDNVPFYGWYDENAKIYLSYKSTYKLFPDSASENITAVYKVAEKEIVANVTATRTENKLAVTVTPNYPSDVTNVKYGYYISTDAAALDVNNITASGDSTVAPHVYMVRVYDIQATTQEKNIYLLGWISYGEEARIYTSLITVAPDGTVTVAEA